MTNTYQVFGRVMGAAVDAGYLAQTPCRNVPLPKVERAEMRFLTPAEIITLADVIRPLYRTLVLVGAYGGLRIGELAGLRRGRTARYDLKLWIGARRESATYPPA